MQTELSMSIEELHKLYAHNVYRYAYRRILDIDTAKQITNDTFRIAWQRGIPPSNEPLPWLLVTAKNLVRNEQRAQGREARLASKAAAAQVLAQRDHGPDNLSEQVQLILQSLREKDREALMLAYWDSLPMAEIATVMQCSIESAKSRLFRARKAFARKAPSNVSKGGSITWTTSKNS